MVLPIVNWVLTGQTGTETAGGITYGTSMAGTHNTQLDVGEEDPLATGLEEILPRAWVSGTAVPTSGTVHLGYFTARRSEPVSRVWMSSQGTAAAGITLAKVGVYQVAESGVLTLLGSTANTPTMFTTTYSAYNTAFTGTGWYKNAGNRYAAALLMIGTTMPNLAFCWQDWLATSLPPRTQGQLAGQTDLPAQIAGPSIVGSSRIFQMIFAT